MIEWNLQRCYSDLLIPASNALMQVEYNGVQFDVTRAKQLREEEVVPQIEKYKTNIQDIVGQKINPGSTKAVPMWLYDIMKVRDPRVNKKGTRRSVDKDSREFMLATYKLPPEVRAFLENLQEYKHWKTLLGTFIDGLIEKVGPDGRLHCEFPLHGTETGRLSSRKPNLQNQPRGSFIRQLYVAPEGRCILQADYSQAELRVAATFSGDANLIRVYNEERDLHAESARKVYGERFDDKERSKAKRVNFGILYEQGAYSLSVQERMPKSEAQTLIDTFWHLYPDTRKWLHAVQNNAVRSGFVRTAFGRIRRFPLITNDVKQEIQRQAGNTVVQSPASDFTLWSLIGLQRDLDPHKSKICITVHDSLVLEVENDYRQEAGEVVQYYMEEAPVQTLGISDVRFKVDVTSGPDWGHTE